MIKKGEKCTILNDSKVQYEITGVKSRDIKINKTIKKTFCYVDLKEVNGNSIIKGVSVDKITILLNT